MGWSTIGSVELTITQLVTDFAAAFEAADAESPRYVSRTGREYKPGLGPHSEDRAVALVLDQMRRRDAVTYGDSGQGLAYPEKRQRCDLYIGRPAQWAVEVKMARFFGDNGKPDDTSIKDLLSPFEVHRSALSDCAKLAASQLAPHKALLIYGFDSESLPLETAIDAFEYLASRKVELGPRASAPLHSLIHPVFSRGTVFGWQIRELLSK